MGAKPISQKSVIGLNFANTGATAKSLILQAHQLVALMGSNPKVDMEQDWKMIKIKLRLAIVFFINLELQCV